MPRLSHSTLIVHSSAKPCPISHAGSKEWTTGVNKSITRTLGKSLCSCMNVILTVTSYNHHFDKKCRWESVWHVQDNQPSLVHEMVPKQRDLLARVTKTNSIFLEETQLNCSLKPWRGFPPVNNSAPCCDILSFNFRNLAAHRFTFSSSQREIAERQKRTNATQLLAGWKYLGGGVLSSRT